MKTLLISLALIMSITVVYGQTEESVDKKSQKQLQKEEKKQQQEAELAEKSALTEKMINMRQFVLEADYLSDQYGNRIMVNSILNFVIVDSTHGVIQFASTTGMGGPNAMGGITTEGRISQYEVTKLKKSGGFNIKILIMTSIGTFDIFFSIMPDGNASAMVAGNWGDKLNYHGRIITLETSKVYKGRSI
jgi:hypothetical protein